MISIFIELALFSQTPDKARVNMRLLKTKSYELIEAKDIPSPFPHYAVLSHTWISPKDEVTYQDIKLRKEDIKNDIFKQKGWSKLKNYCERARKDGWEWAWMDTCCIDKTNAADTQEAINAMFRWYQNAGVCYAYLEDVDVFKLLIDADLLKDVDLLKVLKDVNLFKALKNVGLPKDVDLLKTLKAVNLLKEAIDLDEIVSSGKFTDSNSSLRTAVRPFFTNAKWFSRGWTLQELLAPHYLIFVDRAWCHMGTRESWAVEIEKASHVEARHLTDFKPTDSTKCSIAMKLSWASRRETTLPEDETYSLLGLFGISMPLIYGEGRWRAFNRLQRELIMVYNDDSIFAWKAEQSSKEHLYKERHGVIGPSDERFLIPQREGKLHL